MQERGVVTPIETQRKEAQSLRRNPYIKEILGHANVVLQKGFGPYVVIPDLTKAVSFIPLQDRMTAYIDELTKSDIVASEFRKRGIMMQYRYLPPVPRYMLLEKSTGSSGILVIADQFNSFIDPSEASNKSVSTRAMHLFRGVEGGLLNMLANKIKLDSDRPTLELLAAKAVAKISDKAEFSQDPRVLKLMAELEEEVKTGELHIEIQGCVSELILNGRSLDVYFQDEEDYVKFMMTKDFEDKFKRRLQGSRVNNARWFVDSGEDEDVNEDFKDYLSELANEKSDSLINLFMSGEIAFSLLKREGINFTKREGDHELPKGVEASGGNSDSNLMEVEVPVVPARKAVVELEKKSNENKVTVVPESSEDEDRILRKMIRKERKDKKKQRKNTPSPKTQQRFGKKVSEEKNPEPQKEMIKEVMYVVRPDPITVQFARIQRRLDGKARKQAGIARREGLQKAVREQELRDQQKKERIEKQKLARERRLAAQVSEIRLPVTVDRSETPLEKALREANAMEAVLEVEAVRAEEEAHKRRIVTELSTLSGRVGSVESPLVKALLEADVLEKVLGARIEEPAVANSDERDESQLSEGSEELYRRYSAEIDEDNSDNPDERFVITDREEHDVSFERTSRPRKRKIED